ncbi:hypothetical protein V5799_031007 [Amblyomma americanum]|uniref:Peptidase M13 C-terminal domain-containing protein n=1 Tax=Amblyomma americanum TaxID=6943 RepID=A0AAQ4ELJ4_AMBAM
MAAFYRSCYILRASSRDDTPLVKGWLLEAGVVWPARPANPSVLDTIAFLALKLGWPAVLNIEARTVGGDRTVVLLSPALAIHVISTARLPRLKRVEYFGRLHRAFAPDNTTTVQSIVTFEDAIRIEDVVLPDLAKLAFNRQLNHVNVSGLHRSAEEWNETICKFRRSGSQVSFQTVHPRFVQTFVRLWRAHGEEDMHLFVSWYAVRFAAHFAHESLFNPLSVEVLGSGAFYRGLLCLVPLYVVVGDLTFGVYNALVWSTKVRLDVKALVLSVREAFIHLLSANASFAPGARGLSSWSSVSSVFSVLDYSTENGGFWGKPLRGFPDFAEAFALNWVAARQAIAQNELRPRRSLLPKTLYEIHLVEEDFRARDFVLVPFALAHPLYDVGSTAAVKYGGLGSHVALASARIVLGLYGGEGVAENTTARRHLRTFRDCLEAASVGAPGIGDVAEELVALVALLRAFRRADDADGRRLEGLPGFSSTQLFFIAWCFMRCSVSRQSEEDEADPCSPALSHVEAFSEAFRCGRYTALNPEQSFGFAHACSFHDVWPQQQEVVTSFLTDRHAAYFFRTVERLM